ncbi:hypothetical protein [Myroides odoratus]|uniref:hypothetical protein n=1 Tax=Myroides odoratus TaxID=256 RepID=UPI0039B04ABA
MEWSKIEQNWKKQAEERAIAPSEAAWNKLSKQLDDRNKKIKRLNYTKWMGLAACLVVGGILGLLFLKTDKTIQLPTTDFLMQEKQLTIEETRPQEIQKGAEETDKGVTKLIPITVSKQGIVERSSRDKQAALAEIQIPLQVQYKKERIDSLVIDEIWVRKPQKKIIVDSDNLLDQVEGEIEIEYRETKVKKIIDTARKAVVDLSDSRYEK